jgi:signal transduction histidine kinase
VTRRLYVRLYLTFVAITALSLAVAALLAGALHERPGLLARQVVPLAGSLACPAPGGCQGDGAERLRKTARDLNLDIAVWDAEGRPLFETSPTRLPLPRRARHGWHPTPPGGLWVTPLDDGRLLGLRERHPGSRRGRFFLPLLGGLALLMAVGLYPLSRGITRRIEELAEGARRWGQGDLGHRVPVRGRDEIAALAERFNQAAAGIETLLAQERQMLATASHELRSPLARIRMALELLCEEGDAARRAELSRRASDDIAELDTLVEELLLTARTQPGVPRRPLVDTDLLALLRSEAQTVSAAVTGEPVVWPCEQAMMRRMVRNLFANARLHGGGTAIRAEVRREAGGVLLAVEDDGPGVPESERERIFAPFYRAPGPRPPGDSGLGLGLALCRQVARYHGGDIHYVARQPSGSRFEVRLPGRS